MSGRTRAILAIAALAVLMLAGLLLAGPPVDDTLALRRFLTESGLDVSRSTTPPGPPGTFVLLEDLRNDAEAGDLLRWVEAGGRLVVADPSSRILNLLDVGVGRTLGLVGTKTLAASCAVPEVIGANELAADAGDATLQPSDPGALACFARPGGSYLVVVPRGEGRVVILGGTSALENGLLDHGDNAVLALRLFGGDGPVVFGTPVAPGARSPGLWELLSGAAQLVIIEIVVAAVVFAIARARRLGRPVIEEPIAPIPAGELVRASAGLYRQARAVTFCGRLLRRSASERLARRVGAAPDVAAPHLASLVSASSGLSGERVERAIAGPEPATDAELLALAGELSAITRQIEGGNV